MAAPLPFKVSKPSLTVVHVEIEVPNSGWSQDLLLRSDAHHDNALSNQKAEKLHLDQAKERGALIVDLGDMLDVMQGAYDPRQSKSQLRQEHAKDAYFDSVIDDAAAFYAPYSENWALMSMGNHESSVLKRHGTNLCDRVADGMRLRSGGKRGPVVGSFHGWFVVRFKWGIRKSQSFKFRYTHGTGGGGPVTKDLIQANRQLAFTENADFLLSGHTHDSWYVIQPRTYLDDYGNEKRRDVAMLKLGTYKSEFEAGSGWAAERGHPPRPIGAWWVSFYPTNEKIRYRVTRTDDV